MIRLIQSLTVLALVATGVVIYSCARLWSRGTGADPAILAGPSVIELCAERKPQAAGTRERASPLIAQAEAFAALLNPPPPPPPAKAPAPKQKPVKREPVPAIRPVQATPKFTVRATSYCETRPEKSMALIAEPGGEAAYWVREGERVGHFAIHEIKPGAVVYLAGEELCEMAVEREAAATAIAEGGRSSPSSGPRAAAATEAPSTSQAGPSRRPTRPNRSTVGSVRSRVLD